MNGQLDHFVTPGITTLPSSLYKIATNKNWAKLKAVLWETSPFIDVINTLGERFLRRILTDTLTSCLGNQYNDWVK